MKARTAIHVHTPQGTPEVLRTGDPIEKVLFDMDRLQPQGTLLFNRLTGSGATKRCFIPAPSILRVEEL